MAKNGPKAKTNIVQGASLRGRHTTSATLAREGKVHQITQSGQRSTIDHSIIIVVANWRRDSAKGPAATLQEKAARTPNMYIQHRTLSFLRFSPLNRPGRSSPLPCLHYTTSRTRSARSWGTRLGSFYMVGMNGKSRTCYSLLRACMCCAVERRASLTNLHERQSVSPMKNQHLG